MNANYEADTDAAAAPPAAAAEASASEATTSDQPAADQPAPEEEMAMEADIQQARLAQERDEYLDALRRLQADFENYKKRMVKQQTDYLERAAGALVDKLLPVLDTVDLAVAHGGGEAVEQIWTALNDALAHEGLERIDPTGAEFDPTEHDAVAHEPGDGAPEVVDVLRAGYRWKGKVLRPAMVKVRGS